MNLYMELQIYELVMNQVVQTFEYCRLRDMTKNSTCITKLVEEIH
jgi:hypothetical protein